MMVGMAPNDDGEPGNVADRLVAALAAEGEHAGDGSFDIDAAKGLAKLERYQLADPRAHVLRLIEAGLIGRVAGIRIDFRVGGFTLAWTREPALVIPPASLDRLVTVLVGRESVPDGLPRGLLVQLAVAVLALMRIGARVAITSVDAEGQGARVVFEPGVAQRREPVESGAPAGTRIEVTGLDDCERERELIAEHARAVTIPIVVDHRLASQRGPVDVRLARGPIVLDDVVVGQAVVGEDAEPGVVCLVERGLVIERHLLDGLQPGFVGWIEMDGEGREPPRRDLSQAAYAEPERIAALLDAARAAQARVWSTALAEQQTEALAQIDAASPETPAWMVAAITLVASLGVMSEGGVVGVGLGLVLGVVGIVGAVALDLRRRAAERRLARLQRDHSQGDR